MHPNFILEPTLEHPTYLRSSKMVNAIQKPAEYGIYAKMSNLVSIAPAPLDLEKPRYSHKSNPYTGAQAASIARRNARERNRVKQVNDGFNALRKRLPASIISALSGGSRRGSGKKLSKVDTLRMVVEYIRHLQTTLEESDAATGISKNERLEPHYGNDEAVFGGRVSPYSESVSSPASSECSSSGVSSVVNYSNNTYYQEYQYSDDQFNAMVEPDMLEQASMWWHLK